MIHEHTSVNRREHEQRRPDKRLDSEGNAYLMDVPDATSVIQYPFGECRLARVDMRRDTDGWNLSRRLSSSESS